MRDGPYKDRDPRDLAREAIEFWKEYLDKIDGCPLESDFALHPRPHNCSFARGLRPSHVRPTKPTPRRERFNLDVLLDSDQFGDHRGLALHALVNLRNGGIERQKVLFQVGRDCALECSEFPLSLLDLRFERLKIFLKAHSSPRHESLRRVVLI